MICRPERTVQGYGARSRRREANGNTKGREASALAGATAAAA